MKNLNKILKNFITTSLIICIVIVSIGTPKIIRATENQWATENIKLPVALRGACIEYVDGKMYVIGGDMNTDSYVKTVHIYDFETKIWSSGSSMSLARGYATSSYIDGKIYVMGGYKYSNSKHYSVNDVEIYDIATDTWSTANSMPLNTTHAKSIVYNSKIYVFAGVNAITGSTSVKHKSMQIFDIKDGTWTSNTIPFARYGYTLDLIVDKIYLIGGQDGTTYCSDVKIYDLLTETWSDGSKMSHNVYQAASAVHNNKIYICGGDNNSILLNSVDIYNTLTNTWTKGNALTTAKRHTKSIIVDNKLYLIGGNTSISPIVVTNTIESLQLPAADNRLFAHLYINEKTQLSFSHDLNDNLNLTWKSSAPRVATVDSDGVVKAFETGTTYISAYNKNGAFVDYIPVIITDNDVYRIAVHLDPGQTLKLYMSGKSSSINWSSMDNTVATIDNKGIVTGINKGLTIVKAELNGEDHYIYVRVN